MGGSGQKPTERPGTRPSVTQRVKTTRAKALERLEYERERRYLVALAFIIVDRSRQTAASVLAGALAFRFFLTLLPLTLVAVVGLGYLRTDGASPSEVVKQFGIKGALASTINHSSEFSNPGRTVVLLVGLWGVFSGARTSTATLRAIHALAWGVPVVRWRRRSLAGMLFLGAVVVGFACGGIATRLRSEEGIALGLGSVVMVAVVGAVSGSGHRVCCRTAAGWDGSRSCRAPSWWGSGLLCSRRSPQTGSAPSSITSRRCTGRSACRLSSSGGCMWSAVCWSLRRC